MGGFETAAQELTLVLFTTLAPSGALATAIMGLLAAFTKSGREQRSRMEQSLWAPIAVALVGLVASATHLGNPSNALYVLLGVGSSPLSNEVAAAVVFLGMAGIHWFLAFSRRPRTMLKNIWMCGVSVAAVVFVTAIGFAYDAATIATWHTPFVPASIWGNALLGAPLLVVVTLRLVGLGESCEMLTRRLLGASCVALPVNVVLYALQYSFVAGFENASTSVRDLAGWYPAMIVLFALFSSLGVLACLRTSMRSGLKRPSWDVAGVVLAFVGIFVMRFGFYMTHMTVGL